MYNQEIKERFLAEFTAGGRNEDSCRSIFDTISIKEEALQKDFSQMSMVEAVDAFKGARIGTYGSAYSAQSIVRGYIKWCLKNAVFDDINKELKDFSAESIDASGLLRELLFRNEEEIIRELKSVRVFEDGYPEVVIVLLGWIGVEQKDVTSIKIDDVNIQDKRVNLWKYNKVVDFSDAIAEIFALYARTKEGSRLAGGESRLVFRDDSHDRFVRKYYPRGKSGDPFTPSQIKHVVNHLNSIYSELGNPPKFTGSNIVMSGALYRIWLLEKSGVDVFSIKNKTSVLNAFVINTKLHEILWLYKNYKRAFNL